MKNYSIGCHHLGRSGGWRVRATGPRKSSSGKHIPIERDNTLTSSLVSLVEMIFVFDNGTPSKNHDTLATSSRPDGSGTTTGDVSIFLFMGAGEVAKQRRGKNERENRIKITICNGIAQHIILSPFFAARACSALNPVFVLGWRRWLESPSSKRLGRKCHEARICWL